MNPGAPVDENPAEADISARLDRFFAEEAWNLSAEQVRHRLDLLMRDHARKWFGARLLSPPNARKS
jgi:hypothetical protein